MWRRERDLANENLGLGRLSLCGGSVSNCNSPSRESYRMMPQRGSFRTRRQSRRRRSGCTLDELTAILFALAGLLFGPRIGWILAGDSGTLGHILGAAVGIIGGIGLGVLGGIGFAVLTELHQKFPKWEPDASPARPEPEAKRWEIPEWVVIPIGPLTLAAIAAWVAWLDPKPMPPPWTKPLFAATCASAGLFVSCGVWFYRRISSARVP